MKEDAGLAEAALDAVIHSDIIVPILAQAPQTRSRMASMMGFIWPPSISIMVPLTKWALGEAR
ncbi:hypothetical protein NKDENANG_03462 [Candidatus Entotheonellaceae bacterium PAL068K]